MPQPPTLVSKDAVDTESPSPADFEELGAAILPLIDGEPSAGSGQGLVRTDPATGRSSAWVACAGPAEVDRAVESAVLASSLWRSMPFEERARGILRLAGLIHEQAYEIAELIAREQGKPIFEALTLEILPALDHLRFLVQHAGRYHSGNAMESPHPLYAHKRAHYLYDPLGVVALVTPAPLPFAVPLIQVAAALAMGNAVVLKPSERAPACGLRVGELCLKAGLPAGLVNVIPAMPAETLRLVAHTKIDKVFVTGSVEAGQHVMAAAGCAPRSVVLALGGKHPAVVAGDADVERSARGVVWGALANCGQNCGSVERVYVEDRIASRFVQCVLEEVDRLQVGSPLAEDVDIGPMGCEQRRLEVQRQVNQAVKKGARLLRGGRIPEGPGLFYPPTVLLGPPPSCRLMREETLGPVIPIVTVESLERAIMLANDSDFALTASGWTRSRETAERLMVGLQAGVVTINDVLYSFGEPASTWSGFRKSGIGQNHGTPGLREMCRQRFVSFDSAVGEAPLFAFPYDASARSLIQHSLSYFHGRRRLRKSMAMMRMMWSKRFRARLPLRSFLFPGQQRR